MVGQYGLPSLDNIPPPSPIPGTVVLIDSDEDDAIPRDYATYAAVKFSLAGHPTLLLDPCVPSADQVERLLGAWSGVPRTDLLSGAFPADSWHRLIPVALVLEGLSLSVSTLDYPDAAHLIATLTAWRASLEQASHDERGVSSGELPETVPVVLLTGAERLFSGLDASTNRLAQQLRWLADTSQEMGVATVLLSGESLGDCTAPGDALAVRLSFHREPQSCFRFGDRFFTRIRVIAQTSKGGRSAPAWIDWEPQTGFLTEVPTSSEAPAWAEFTEEGEVIL